MTDKTRELLIVYIVPFWETKIRIYNRDKICDRQCIIIMQRIIRQLNDYAVGVIDNVEWNVIRFLKEAIIPLETRKILLDLEYYSPNDPNKYDDCIDDLKQLAIEMENKKVKNQSRGLVLHFDMLGRVSKKQELKNGKVINHKVNLLQKGEIK